MLEGDKLNKNLDLVLKVLQTLLFEENICCCQHKRTSVYNFIYMFVNRVMNILKTGKSDTSLPKRTAEEKQQKVNKRGKGLARLNP